MRRITCSFSKGLLSVMFLLSLFALTSCKEEQDPIIENKVEQTSKAILKGTKYETTVYNFKSNIEGPRVAIIGGIHGDEIAGWMVAEGLLTRTDFIGEVMIIPKANILADTLQERYPGVNNKGVYDSIKYSDLNRTFPGKENGTPTEKIAYAISQTVEDFNPAYIIDLHESRRSYSDVKPLIGDEIIYGNKKSAMKALEIVEIFNDTYLEASDTPFIVDASPPEGSFNYYFGKNFDAVVFTFETNRQLHLTKRIQQQEKLLDVFFQKIWN